MIKLEVMNLKEVGEIFVEDGANNSRLSIIYDSELNVFFAVEASTLEQGHSFFHPYDSSEEVVCDPFHPDAKNQWEDV